MERIGEYLLRRTIGEGGMGRVYEGEERLSGRAVAVKVLHKELGRYERVRRLFINEMEILARLEHPNIVRSLASVEVDDNLAMVLEFVDGCTLRDLLVERGQLTVLEAIHVVACVAEALVAAHGHDPPVIHRDLKPDNVMVSREGAVKVMDFGIAKLLERVDQTNTQAVGTLLYMSPEQIDARSIDHRSDIYSLGLVFYELLAGRPPFIADSPRAQLNLQCTGDAPPLDANIRQQMPPDVEQLLVSMLDKDPDRRPQSAQRVLERLGAVRQDSYPPVSRPQRVETTLYETDPLPPPPRAQAGETLKDPSWHASNAREAWLARFELQAQTEPRGPSPATPRQDTVPLPPMGVDATAPGEVEFTLRASLVIIAVLMIVAGLVTYLVRAL